MTKLYLNIINELDAAAITLGKFMGFRGKQLSLKSPKPNEAAPLYDLLSANIARIKRHIAILREAGVTKANYESLAKHLTIDGKSPYTGQTSSPKEYVMTFLSDYCHLIQEIHTLNKLRLTMQNSGLAYSGSAKDLHKIGNHLRFGKGVFNKSFITPA